MASSGCHHCTIATGSAKLVGKVHVSSDCGGPFLLGFSKGIYQRVVWATGAGSSNAQGLGMASSGCRHCTIATGSAKLVGKVHVSSSCGGPFSLGFSISIYQRVLWAIGAGSSNAQGLGMASSGCRHCTIAAGSAKLVGKVHVSSSCGGPFSLGFSISIYQRVVWAIGAGSRNAQGLGMASSGCRHCAIATGSAKLVGKGHVSSNCGGPFSLNFSKGI
jgi:hypothetical protein